MIAILERVTPQCQRNFKNVKFYIDRRNSIICKVERIVQLYCRNDTKNFGNLLETNITLFEKFKIYIRIFLLY